MAGHAEELGGRVSSAKEELTATTAPMPVAVPAGMTRAEFKEWKEMQTRKAKERLQDLEERLQRLQTLEGKMKRLTTSSNDAIDAVPDHWTLPGTADYSYEDTAFQHNSHTRSFSVSFFNVFSV